MKRNITPLLFGILFIIAGLGYIGSMFFNWRFDIFFDGWWTLFIIVPAFVSILANRPGLFNISALLVGVLLLLSAQDLFPSMNIGTIIVSAVIIFSGLSLISNFFKGPKSTSGTYTYNINMPPNSEPNDNYEPTKNQNDNYEPNNNSSGNYESAGTSYEPTKPNSNNHNGQKYRTNDNNSRPDYNAILSGIDTKNTCTDFQGASVSAIMGGVDLDLRDVIITRDIEICCTAIMGGIDILAPRNVRINLNQTNIMGGTGCTALTMPADANVPLVTFTCTTVMGGIDIT